jgi:hypothetical protein
MPTRLVRLPGLAAAAAAVLVVGGLPAPPPAAAATCGPTSPCIRAGDARVTEGHSGARRATVEITLSHPATRRLGIAYRTADGTARAGADYAAATGTAVVEPGQAATGVQVEVLGDRTAEADQTFFVDLGRVGFALSVTSPFTPIVQDGRGVVTIVNDDGPAPPPTAPPTSPCPPELADCLAP